jgi:uncharacterized membrane protein YfcA
VARPLLIFAIAFAATVLGSMGGGSSSLLTTPAWVALGVSLPTAVGTDKIAGTFWTLVGARNYLHGRVLDWRLASGMIGAGAVAAVIGARVTASVDPFVLKRVIGALILAVIGGMALQPRFGLVETRARLGRGPIVALSLPLGFYEGLLGSGNSIATTLLLCLGRGFDLLRSLGHYYLVAAGWCGVAAISYGLQGAFDLRLALPATAGALAGGYLGSRLGNRFGAGAVRAIFLLAGTTLALRLLLGR